MIDEIANYMTTLQNVIYHIDITIAPLEHFICKPITKTPSVCHLAKGPHLKAKILKQFDCIV